MEVKSINKTYNRISKFDLCLGCGLCSSVFGHENCEMNMSDTGFYRPTFKSSIDERKLRKICPGIRVHGSRHCTLWGNVEDVVEGWARNATLRYKAASGGIVSSIAIYMLESGKADAVLQVGVKDDNYLYNELKISRSIEDVINNAQSRYAPALTLVNIKQILESSNDNYVFIGKPCDIAGIKNFMELHPIYRNRIVLFISIFCAGMPSYKATEKAWKMSGRKDAPMKLKYRGDGWPGCFHATWQDGYEFKLSYNDSWGKILGRQLGYRCKICPDGIGMLADIAVGDSWNTQNGYPDFTESDGRCFVFVRTKRGLEVLKNAQKHGAIEFRRLEIDNIKYMQAYQYERRKYVGWRLLPIMMCSRWLIDFDGLGIFKQAKKANITKAIRNLKGSMSRMTRILLKVQR